MNTNRPRHSILSMFDPLSAATSDADKENLPSFVQQSHHPVVLPKKRLVDIGDTTLDEVSVLDIPAEKQEVPLQQESDDNDAKPSLETLLPRTPLTELTLGDTDSTRLDQGNTYPQPSTSFLPSSLITLAPDVGNPSCHDAVIGTDEMTPGNVQVPQIVISYNSPEKLPQRASHDNITTSLIASPEEQTVHPNLHLRAPTTSSQDCNRFSLDLQASFQMYLQSEASFDLLNDKISLVEPMDSQTTDDEHFDFELDKDNLQDAIAKLKRSRKSDASPLSPTQDSSDSNFSHIQVIPDQESDDSVLDSPMSPSNDLQLPQSIPSPFSGSSDKSSKRWSTSSGIPSPTSYRGPKKPSPTPAKAVPSAIPQSKQRRFSSPVVTPQRLPAVVLPPAIQALRIVKRTQVSNGKAESSSDASARETETPLSSLATRPASRNATNTLLEAQPLRIQLPSSAKPANAAPSTSIASTGFGPRRMTVTTDSQVGVTLPKSSQTSLVNATLGPKRILKSNDGPNLPLSKPSSIPSGLKQPKRFESSTSNLPRPSGMVTRTSTSRLPTLVSGLQSKLRRPVAGIGKGRVVSGD